MIVIVLLFLLFLFSFLFRDYLFSFYLYLKKRVEGKKLDITRLNSLRADLIHESKKKFASLGQIINSCSENPAFLSGHLDYFNQLISQLKTLVEQQRENLLLSSEDVFLYAKLKNRINKTESRVKKKRFNREMVERIRKDLKKLQKEIEKTVEFATKRFSFNFIDLVKDAIKIVRIEKRDTLDKKKIDIAEDYAETKTPIRLPYSVYKDWLRVLTNLIRNAVEAVEAKQSRDGVASRFIVGGGDENVAADFSLRGGSENVVADLGLPGRGAIGWVKISTKQHDSVSVPVSSSISVIIEDSGIGMNEITRSSFYQKGFTSGKEGGSGLGVSEESVELIHRYGDWQIESELGNGTKITIEVERERAEEERIKIEGKRTISQRVFLTPTRVVLTSLFLVIVSLGILFTVDKYSRFWEDWNPAYAQVAENHLMVLNKSNEVLWDTVYTATIALSPMDEKPLVRVVDLDGDGKIEILVALRHTEKTTGKVVCFNYKKEKLWEFLCGDSAVYMTPDGPNTGYFLPRLLEIEDLIGNSKKEVIVNSIHARWFPDQLAVLDCKGDKISEYWHPGGISCLYCLDLDNDGEKEIILGGINNRMDWRPVVSILHPQKTFGQAMPYLAERNIARATEKWYLLIPHIKKNLPHGLEWEQFLTWVNSMEFFSGDEKMDVLVIDGRAYHLNANFESDYYYFHLNGFLAWKPVGLPSDLTKEDSVNWKNIEVWKDGIKVR